MKIGIITLFDLTNVNYGNRLQAYALNHFINTEINCEYAQTLYFKDFKDFKRTKQEPILSRIKRKISRDIINRKDKKIPEELQLVIESFREQECNTPALCRAACDGYMNLRDCYSKYRNIVLQPIVSAQKKSLIQYDVLKRRFVPSVCLDNEFAKLIQAHIDKFGLNDSKCRTMELIRFCKDVVDGVVKPIKGRYNNLIVDLFVDKIFGMEEKKYKAICKVILAQAAYKQDWVSINDC